MNSNKIHIIFLAHAGGYADLYTRYRPHLNLQIVPKFIEYPGHGRRLREPLLKTIEELTYFVWGEVQELIENDYAFYGHSLGGRIAYLLTHKIWEAGQRLPRGLFLSSAPAPRVRLLSPEEVDYNTLVGPSNQGSLASRSSKELELIRQLFYPALRNDVEAAYKYIHSPRRPLPVPIKIFFAVQDEFPEVDYRKWDTESTSNIEYHRFNGNHFFNFVNMKEICDIINEALS